MTQQNRKILVLFAHPGQRYSKVNVELAEAASKTRGVTLVDLYAEYPRFKIDIETEQERLLEHDVIVFQFPLFWYSTPALLKEWQDLVLEYGFAYGEGGDKIAGKLFVPVITTGGPEDFYRTGGRNNFHLREFLAPLEQTANLCGLRFVPPYTLFAALKAAGGERMEEHVNGYERFLKALRDDRLDMDLAASMPLLSARSLPILEEAKS
ncbi:NAD(P)H-dependent oxidoreductase [Hoeflea sp. TYP-13]|uniref:NAD(P)H-dependent oxidoreductase n=1 Tax=Hoeflea sp. TYP-13 TaxID=3230023 RepID=UPI0034C678F5